MEQSTSTLIRNIQNLSQSNEEQHILHVLQLKLTLFMSLLSIGLMDLTRNVSAVHENSHLEVFLFNCYFEKRESEQERETERYGIVTLRNKLKIFFFLQNEGRNSSALFLCVSNAHKLLKHLCVSNEHKLRH